MVIYPVRRHLTVGATAHVEVQTDARHDLAHHHRGILKAARGVVNADQEALRFFAANQLVFPGLARRDVAGGLRGADDVAVPIVNGRHRERDADARPVLADAVTSR